MRLLIAALLCSLVTLPACANFGVVEEGQVYRRSQPSEDTLDELIEEKGIRTVLRLRGGKPGENSYEDSYNPTQKHHIKFVQIPMSASRFPKKWELVQLCEAIEQGPYPMLVHCKAGADRTGLASAIYLLHRGASMERAREELTIWYGHLSMFGTEKLGETLDMYEPWMPVMSVGDWAREIYERPENDELPESYGASVSFAVSAWINANPERAAARQKVYLANQSKERGADAATIGRESGDDNSFETLPDEQ